jgi:hypothetical protein
MLASTPEPYCDVVAVASGEGTMRRQGSKSVMRYTVIIAAVLACALTAGCSSPPPDMTVNGTVVVTDDPVAGEYPPVDVGSEVTVTDPSGK